MEKGVFSHLFDGSFSTNKSGFHGKSANFAAVLNAIRFFFMQIDYALIRFTRGKNAARGVAHSLLFSLFLFVSLQLSARDITPKAALSIARRYVEVGKDALKRQPTRSGAAANASPYYIVNDARGHGFVVVAGDDAMGEVLAYSATGQMDTTRLNPEARYLLQAYRQVYTHLKQGGRLVGAAKSTRTAGGGVVAPLLKTKWGQGYPYNKKTGYFTGCVATAMAQIMNFHRWPAQGRGKNRYTVNYEHAQREADFSQSHYDWGNMLNDYSRQRATAQQEDAVALLMNDAGISVYMQYTPSGSGAQSSSAAKALRDHFDYDAAIVTKANEGNAHFAEIIQDELRHGFPLYISGDPRGGGSGHAWVCDGFDSEGMFHMNFGWDGGADGYYSLTALNLSSTGSEFQGRPLSFGLRLHIIAAHPNKPGTPKLNPDIADGAPNLAFNLSGEMHFVGTPPTQLTAHAQLSFSHFVNQSYDKFRGDVGIGIYTTDHQLVRPCASAAHSKGGYTQERFKFNDGEQPSGGLVEEDVVITTDLSGLADGRYILAPICAAWKGGTLWGDWVRMKQAPRVVMEVKQGKITYVELPAATNAYQFETLPTFDKKLRTGGTNTLRLNIRKLNSMPFDGQVKVDFINDQGAVAYTVQTQNKVDFEMFAATRVTLPISLPTDMAAGRYELRTTIFQADTHEQCPVRTDMHETPFYATVEQGEVPSNLLQNAVGFVQDNAMSTIPNEDIDISFTPLFKLNCVVTLADGAHYQGGLSLCLIDTENERQIVLMKKPQQVDLSDAHFSEQIVTGWLRPRDLKIINNRRYRLAVMGEVDGKAKDFWPAAAPPFYVSIVKGPFNKYPDEQPNGIQTVPFTGHLRFADGMLEVQQAGLVRIEVYSLSGMLVSRSHAVADNRATMPLPKGTYVVRIVTHNGQSSKVIR